MKKIIDREYIEQSIRQELAKWQEGSEVLGRDETQQNEDNSSAFDGNESGKHYVGSYKREQKVGRDSITTRPLTEREAERFENAIVNGIIDGHSIEELARSCCYSLSTFKRRFSEQYSLPPHRWMLLCRLHLASQILAETNEPISSVSQICGFINNSHFIATFRRHYGITPRQYRTNEKRD